MSDKLYVCLSDSNEILLNERYDVEAAITNAEEGDDSMGFTVLGTIDKKSELPPFLVILKTSPTITIYEVVHAKDEEDAKIVISSKKRYNRKKIDFKSIKPLTGKLKEYYD